MRWRSEKGNSIHLYSYTKHKTIRSVRRAVLGSPPDAFMQTKRMDIKSYHNNGMLL